MFEPYTEQQIQEWEMKQSLNKLYKLTAIFVLIGFIAWVIGLITFVQTMNQIKVDRSKCVNWCKTKE
jgi:hypothetical protein